ncbi:MAG: hypothetical protein WC602_02055 [archaeon]
MAVSLNFGKSDKERISEFMAGFPAAKTTAPFEEMRCVIGQSTVTLYHTGKITVQGNDSEKVKEKILGALKEDSEEAMIGIDETGRGESFGPFVVAFVLGRKSDLRELRDSKKTSRESLEEKYGIVSEKSLLHGAVSFGAEQVDSLRNQGITMNQIEERAIDSMLDFVCGIEPKARIVVDGSRMNLKRKNVEFLPKADDLEPVVGAASIAAKWLREKSADKGKRKTWNTGEKQ